MLWLVALLVALVAAGALWWALSSSPGGSMSTGTPAFDPGAFAPGTAGADPGQIGTWGNAAGPGLDVPLATIEEYVQAELNGIPPLLANPNPPPTIEGNW